MKSLTDRLYDASNTRLDAGLLKHISEFVWETLAPYRKGLPPGSPVTSGVPTWAENEIRVPNRKAAELLGNLEPAVARNFGLTADEALYAINSVCQQLVYGATCADGAPELTCRIVVGHRDIPVPSTSEHAEVGNKPSPIPPGLAHLGLAPGQRLNLNRNSHEEGGRGDVNERATKAYDQLAALAWKRVDNVLLAAMPGRNRHEAFTEALETVSGEQPDLVRLSMGGGR